MFSLSLYIDIYALKTQINKTKHHYKNPCILGKNIFSNSSK